MSVRQRLRSMERQAPPCQACKGTGIGNAASAAKNEHAVWWLGLAEADRQQHIRTAYFSGPVDAGERTAEIQRLLIGYIDGCDPAFLEELRQAVEHELGSLAADRENA